MAECPSDAAPSQVRGHGGYEGMVGTRALWVLQGDGGGPEGSTEILLNLNVLQDRGKCELLFINPCTCVCSRARSTRARVRSASSR